MTKEAAAREKKKREKRIMERKQHEAELRKVHEERAAEESGRRDAQKAVLARSNVSKMVRIKHSAHIAEYRRKQNAAHLIQCWWRNILLYRQRKRDRQNRRKGRKGSNRKNKVTTSTETRKQSAAAHRRAKEEFLKAERNYMAKTRVREITVVRAFAGEFKYSKPVAALTIQLWWRQLKRQQLLKAAARRKKLIIDEWNLERQLQALQPSRQQQQNARVVKTFRSGSAPERYPPQQFVPTSPEHAKRGTTRTQLPSAAAVSFNFAVCNYYSNRTRKSVVQGHDRRGSYGRNYLSSGGGPGKLPKIITRSKSASSARVRDAGL